MVSVMAAHHPAGAAQLCPVMTGNGVIIPAVEAVDPDAIAAMLSAGAVAVASAAEIKPDMGASPW